MPNLSDTKKLLETFATNNITVPIAYDNIEYSGSKDFYVSLRVMFIDSDNVNIGSQLSKRIRHDGIIVLKLYSEIGIGTEKSLDALDSMKTQIENKSISNNLFTYAAESIRQGADDNGSYVSFLRIPFVSDEC